ncbi:MAG: GAF domain-containing protein [Chloroflexi bacterium]|nr:GAF domain-containing protein [Chloroflexota bacterium]
MSAASKITSKIGVGGTRARVFPLAIAPDQRAGFVFTAAACGLAAIALIVFLVAALQSRSHPFFGATLTPYLVVDGNESISAVPWAGLNAGLKRFDRIIAINDQPLFEKPTDYAAARQKYLDIFSGLAAGDRVEVDFERPASDTTQTPPDIACRRSAPDTLTCRVGYRLTELPGNDFLAYFVIPYLMGVLSLAVGVTVLLLRPNQPTARLVTLFSVVFAIFMGGAYNSNNTYQLIPLWLVAVNNIGGLTAALALVFPIKIMMVYRRPALVYVPLALGMAQAVLMVAIFLNPPSARSFPVVWQTGIFTGAAAAVLLIVNLLRRRRLATTATVRDQSNTALIGVAMTIGPIAFWIANTLAQNLTGSLLVAFNTSAIMPFFIMPPVSFAYATLQYRTFDTDQVISKGITYVLLLVALVTSYFLVVFGSSLITREALQIRASDPLLIALTVFVMAVLFLPARTFLQDRIDRIYFRMRTNYQERLETFSRLLTDLVDINQIIHAFHRQLDESLAPSSAFVFLPDRQSSDYIAFRYPQTQSQTDIRFGVGSGVVALLDDPAQEDLIYLEAGRSWPAALRSERARLSILRTLVIARMRGRQQLIGFVCIGPPLSGAGVYNFEQLRFVQNLTSQIAIAVERAQVVESLERRVRELDTLSQVSQAVNFTIEYDDLLELISAQTGKLIDAPHFYIVLRDAATDRLYFAFFSEDYDRYRERENRRWTLGRDLFSEVLRDGQPLRVGDYAAAMRQRHAEMRLVTPDIKAWMGVPMIVGSNTIGLLALGSSDPDTGYTTDQLRIFGDIGALAATSIEKARLFGETNLRARQLSVLNTISRQMASELHVESLLELITRSAVDILNAEAGSLLLTLDDTSGDLEFRVAVGSSGQELIGRRFPAGRGLVGEVASTGKAVIVNDTANDPRWGGEVAQGRFTTTAVLAVPLITQNRVIGVLEMLNRKDGGVYVQEDLDLLTTFAGQAAIAIETARRVEVTDLQLRQRVDELQAMERIDAELNRSLDLRKVADATMRWAIANTGATAGVLGLVLQGDPPQLQIIASYGYQSGDEPEGAEGKLWPLDRGIVSRVMRTRQADLVPDVRIDRDYIPSLKGSKSQLTIPMLSAGDIHALLVLEKDTDPRLNLLDMSFAQRLAEHAIIAITNAQFYDELTRANQSKSEFVSFVAHELKTPMTSIKGYTELLLSGVTGSMTDQQNTFLNTIRSNIERMSTLVSDLNDVTKLQTNNLHMEFSAVDFRNVITETLRPLHRQIEEKQQDLVINTPKNMPNIWADQNRLIQVLTNLVSNAHKYTPPEGTITINAQVIEHVYDNKNRDIGPFLQVSVSDTGIGMSEEDLIKLFTPYFRSENPQAREQPGTGLGLTITHGIVQRHGGKIWVESALNQGTTFFFTVPLAAEPAVEELEEATQPLK